MLNYVSRLQLQYITDLIKGLDAYHLVFPEGLQSIFSQEFLLPDLVGCVSVKYGLQYIKLIFEHMITSWETE